MKIDIEILKKLERSIDIYVPIKILGYGEISLVFELLDNPEQIAYKRIPIFDNETQVKRHIWAYNEYNRLLKEDVGLNLPEYDPAESVGNKVIHKLSDQDIKTLILLVMREMKKVWDYSKNHNTIDLGLDGQISNFAIVGFDPNSPKVDLDSKLIYFDTSTPMFRVDGNEAMEAVLFLKSAPSFLRWLLKALFLEETIGRYYDWRKVTIDLVANFFKEQKAELIPELINLINKFFEEEANDFKIEPLTLEEVEKYYKSDSRMWVIFQSVRRFDRFLKTKIFKKKYDFFLPGKIER